MTTSGMTIVRLKEIPWEDRINVDNWPSRAGMYYDNRDLELCIRLIDYPLGSVEPRHVHAGMHATTVLKGRAIIDGLTLGPLDVVIGPSNEPHGPLEYPDGCILLSAFQGSYFHNEVETLSTEKQYRLIQQAEIPWRPHGDSGEVKTLVDRGVGRLLLEAYRFSVGADVKPQFLAALVVDGAPELGGQTLGAWDFVYRNGGEDPGNISFPAGGTLLAVTMR
jgi:quercetin dioxygenase-like cupin family protein